MRLIEPALKDEAFLADVQAACGKPGFRLWWLGQSGYLLQWENHHALIDPYLSDALTEKYATTDKPHIRMTERVIDPARLDFIDVTSSSHNHTDHLDAATLKPLMTANPAMRMVASAANITFAAERVGVAPDRLDAARVGEPLDAGGFRFEAVPAAHDELETDERGQHRYVGYIIRFGAWSVYHSGDTQLYAGMAERLRRFGIDVAILPINGRGSERRVAGNLWGREAAQLAKDMGAGVVIPCHYEMFTFNTEPPDELVATCGQIGQDCWVLGCGERWQSEAAG